jgi:hypothetical protein
MPPQWPTGIDWIAMTGASLVGCVAMVWRDYGFDPAVPPRLSVMLATLAAFIVVRLARGVCGTRAR